MTLLALIITTLIIAGGTPRPAAASPAWLRLHDDSRVLYELGPVQAATDTVRTVTLRRTYRVPGERAYAIDTVVFDCRAATFRFQDTVIYDRDGDVVNRYHPADQPVQVPVGTYLDRALRASCGGIR